MREIRVASLCSGVGGLDLAVESVIPDARLVWYAQYEPPNKKGKPDRNQYAAQIMAHRFPGVPNLGDITTIDYADVEPVDILTAGFPCTDLSLAGLREGLMPGTRSGVWSHVARAIAVLRPPLVLIENVRSLTSARAHCDLEQCPRCMGEAGNGEPPLRALGAVLGDLANIGFDAEWTCVRASDGGGCHRRERVFVLAWPADAPNFGRERLGVTRGRRPRPSDGDLLTTADPEGNGRNARRTEPVRILRGPDAAECGSAPADAQGAGLEEGREGRPGERAHAHPDGRGLARQPEPDRQPQESQADDDHNEHDPDRPVLAWGDYAPAIERWERILGRPAPRPTDDRGRLAPQFVEWMVGLPAGWVTEVPGIPRNAQLHGLGNIAMPQQAAAAFRELLGRVSS
jgi:DNA (cytosine-5)-methyltransferase 1